MTKDTFSSVNYSFLNRDLNPSFFRKYVYSQDEVSEVFCLKKNEAINLSGIKKVKQKTILNSNSLKESIFTGHSLKPTHQKNTFYEKPFFGWVSITFIVIFTIYAFIQASNSKKVQNFMKSFVGIRFLNQLLRDVNFLAERITYPLLLISFASTAMFFYGVVSLFGENSIILIGINPFLKIFGAIILLFILKIFVVKVSGILFKTDKEESDYTSGIFLFSMFSGLFLLPISICLLYIPNIFFLYLGFIILLIMFGFRLIRTFFFSTNESKFSRYYLFLYLCIVEIAPLFVLIKLVFLYKS
ncbi:MAG: DUF4271 domain-containing protein [Bacteroidetes bacterium]|nr:DUF4271 domain-containing protein [Bacteroidota bacterium]